MIHLMINEKPYRVAEGRTVLEACREYGIHIPTLCYHPALEPYGACRLCMVEVSQPAGKTRLVAACVYPCEEGLSVHTDTAAVRKSRRMTAELLLASAYNSPDILALAEEYGVRQVRYRLPEEDPCVLCALCVRACQEIVGVNAISMIQRGMAKQVSPPFQVSSSECIACGTCVLICPTGALTLSDVTTFQGIHTWSGMDCEFERVYCRVCGDTDLRPHFVEDIVALLGDLDE